MSLGNVSRLFVCIALSAGLVLSACSDDSTTSSTPQLSKAEVEQKAMAALTAKTGQQAPQITCPGNLNAQVGAKMVCSIVLDAKTYDVTVTVTQVNGTTAELAVEVAGAPRG